MAHIVFIIPTDLADLLSSLQKNYSVKDVVIPSQIIQRLDDAQISLREEGPDFILDHFDTYYSVLHHRNTLRPDVVFKAYKHLVKAVIELSNTVTFLLNDKDSLNDEVKAKMVNVLKMLIYIFSQFVICLEEKKKNSQDFMTGKAKNKDKTETNFDINKSQALNALSNLIQCEINLFWEPPIVEHDFVGLLAELCFTLLQNPSIKSEKNVILEIFDVFGNLVKTYDYGKNFVTRMIRTIRMYEHVVQCIADGIKLVVQEFNCQSLIHHFVKEATEWQVDETFQDVQGTRCCSIFLTELAISMPDLILPEVLYLNRYLAHESIPLRLAVLNVIYEMILKVLTNHDLTDEEKDLRDEFFDVLLEHVADFSAIVRSKVIQNFSKLQKENAIPLSFQNEVLTVVVKHLYDKAAAVRKSAINCVTTFLEHNPFGANLQLKKSQEQLTQKRELLNKLESVYKEAQYAKIQQLETEWNAIQNDLQEVIQQKLEEAEDEEVEETLQVPRDQDVDQIRTFLEEKKFVEAFTLCQKLKNNTNELKNIKKTDEDYELKLYMAILHSIYVNSAKIISEFRITAGMTAEDIQKIETLEAIIKYFENTTEFLTVIESALPAMKELLFSQAMSDTQEAIQFFVTAFQFQIDHSTEGILEILKIMRCSEQERHTAVIEAFKTIYLTTDANNMAEHTTTILNRLISIVKDLTYDNLEDFENIVSEWTAKGILDNSVIDKCWQFYTQREPVSDEDARICAEILRMAAMGRSTIISKNINVVSKIMFAEQHKTSMLFLASSCRLLAAVGLEKIDVQSETSPFRISHNDQIFQNLVTILVDGFFEKHPYYSEAMDAAFDFIFRVCSNPIVIATKVITQVSEKLKEHPTVTLVVTRMCGLLGCVAIGLLGYLDNSVYRELKRRNYLREERKKQSKDKKLDKNEKKKKKKKRESALNLSTLSEASTNESVLMGAEAEDTDAEFILSVLENDVVSPKGVLGQYSSLIINICQRPDTYTQPLLQQAAVTALMRYMLVSSKFCHDNTRLLFTILEKTAYPDIQCTVLTHCSDLLTRFPNVVEPWSPRIYGMLKSPLVRVRKVAFFTLANLILRSMIRPHVHISEMAVCLIDKDREMNEMCKSFFVRMAQKENNFVNIIPDIFTNIVRLDELSEIDLRFILKFLFDVVDSSKRLDNLVDRFCCKYTPDENIRLNRNITYCLTLINYNDKALRKLREMFPMYKHHMHDAEIYSMFNQILAECNKAKVGKADLKPIVSEIETCIASVFEVDEDGNPSKPPPITQKTKTRGKPRKKNSRRQNKGSEEDSEEERTPAKSKKPSKGKRVSSESDDEVFDEAKTPLTTKKPTRTRSARKK